MGKQENSPLGLIGVEDILFILNYIKIRINPSNASIDEINVQRNSAYKERNKEKGLRSPDTTLNNICTRRIGLDQIHKFDELIFAWLVTGSDALKEQILSHLSQKEFSNLEKKVLSFFESSMTSFGINELPKPNFLNSSRIEEVQEQLKNDGFFDPDSLERAEDTVLRSILQRRGQSQFRKKLIKAYQGHCNITDCNFENALEAAHIIPYQGTSTNYIENGLLLRADVHTLFDLYQIAIHPESLILYAKPALLKTTYAEFHRKTLDLPYVSRKALGWRWERFNSVK